MAIVAFPLFVEDGFDLMTIDGTTIALDMVVKVVGLSMTTTVDDRFPFSINTLGSTCVHFGSVRSYCWSNVAF